MKSLSFKLKFIFVVVVMAVFVFAYSHEYAHKEAAEVNGCDARIDYNPLSSYNRKKGAFMSTTYNCSVMSTSQYRSIHISQSNVEAIGYQLLPIYGFLLSIMIYLILSDKI